MATRGRKSPEKEKNVKSILQEVSISKRLEPPPVLSPAEAGVWHTIVNSKPADWFDEDTKHLLIAYCKHCITAAIVDQQLSHFQEEWFKTSDGLDRFKTLTDMREKQSRAITALARSMRLTQQAQYDTQKASRKNKSTTTSKKPWEL